MTKLITPPPLDPNLHVAANPNYDFGSHTLYMDLQAQINEGYEYGVSNLTPYLDLNNSTDIFIHGYHCGLRDRNPSCGPYKDMPVEMISNLLYTIVIKKDF